MMRTLLNRGFSQRSQIEVELLALAWMLLGGNGGGRIGGDDALTHTCTLLASNLGKSKHHFLLFITPPHLFITTSHSFMYAYMHTCKEISYFCHWLCLFFPSTQKLLRLSACWMPKPSPRTAGQGLTHTNTQCEKKTRVGGREGGIEKEGKGGQNDWEMTQWFS